MSEQLLPGARPTSEGKRRRNKSVSNMEKASIEPPEEEEEERAVVNGNGVAVTPGQSAGRDLCRGEGGARRASTPMGVALQPGQRLPLPSNRGCGFATVTWTQANFGGVEQEISREKFPPPPPELFSASHNHMTRP